jgi:methylglyoxal synthase
MSSETVLMGKRKKIALVAHDNKKGDLLEWVKFNKYLLSLHELYATGTTGKLIEKETGLKIIKLKSGPLGGDMQVGAKIANGEIDFLIFFWDPLESLPHDPDVKALLRMAVVWNIPVACNRSTADFMVSSTIMDQEYLRIIPDYENYRQRRTVGSGD